MEEEFDFYADENAEYIWLYVRDCYSDFEQFCIDNPLADISLNEWVYQYRRTEFLNWMTSTFWS